MWAHTNIQKHTHTKFKSWGPMDEDHPTSSAKIGNYRGNMQTYIPTHHLSPQKKKSPIQTLLHMQDTQKD